MPHDVFISHSARDKLYADAVCAKLESQSIRCWFAPRDIRPGMDWGAAIIEAIDGARVMLLVFSSHANGSPQIKREVERAVNKELIVVPVRVEDVKPTGNLEYFLGTPHWLDAITPPFDRHLDYIGESVKFWLERIASDRATSGPPRPTMAARDQAGAAAPPDAIARTRSRPKWIAPTIAALTIALLGTAAYFGTRYSIAQQEGALGNRTDHSPAGQGTDAIPVPITEVLDQIGEQVASQGRAPGFAFLVQYQGKTLFSRGYGLADIENKLAVTPDTRFPIGSISKQFAAASILLLKQQKKDLSLDEKLSTWLPQLPNAGKITLRMLLYHTSGLHNFPDTREHDWPVEGAIAPDKIFSMLALDKSDFEPGSQYDYSNTNYAALAEVVSRVSRKPYSEFREANIFSPLHMSDTGNGYEAQKAGIAVPYKGVRNFTRDDGWSLDLYYGAGSIVSTVVDLAKWDQALLSGSLLDEASMHELWTPGTLANGKRVDYAMGFVPTSLHGHLEVEHNGYLPFAGGYCFNAIFPDDGLAIAVLSNGSMDDFEGQPEQIVRRVFESLLLADDPSVSALVAKIFNQVRQGAIDKSLLTEQMSEAFNSKMPGVMHSYATLGDLEGLVFKGKITEKGQTKYVYRGSFASGEHQIEISIDSEGKVGRYLIVP